MRVVILLLSLFMWPNSVFAWWNDSWSNRMPITVQAPQQAVEASPLAAEDSIILIRLHSGNFPDFFLLQEKLTDLRFVGSDDKSPLVFHVDSFDIVNQLLFIWVKVPGLTPGSSQKIWMYYGNETAVTAADTPGTFNVAQSAIFHFSAGDTELKDATAYQSGGSLSGVEVIAASLIGAGAKFSSNGQITINDLPSLAWSSADGFTFSAWIKPEINSVENSAVKTTILSRTGPSGTSLNLLFDLASVTVNFSTTDNINNKTLVFEKGLEQGKWQHISLILQQNEVIFFINGALIGKQILGDVLLSGPILVGAKLEDADGFIGEMDEIRFAKKAETPYAIHLAVKNQGMIDEVVSVAAPEQMGSESSETSGMFDVILKSTDALGWALMILMLFMSLVTWVVMAGKWFYLVRVKKDNALFMKKFVNLIARDPAELDKEDSEEDKDLEDSPITQALFGKHDHFQSSPLYRLYHRGITEIRNRSKIILKDGLTTRSNNAIRASLDAQTIREAQRLHSQMIFLTIAITGGPFVGLFGTVMGVMMTFAGIAASGDVNIAAIAPGVAAALLTTLGGLFVAIPALFGYNYLNSLIKAYIADMRVFCDEFSTRLAEYYGRH